MSRVVILVTAFASVVAAQRSNAQGNETKLDIYNTMHLSFVTYSNENDLQIDPVLHDWVQDLGRKGCWYANQVRVQHGRHQLYYSASLTNLAARHSNWMASTSTFQHQNLYGLGAWVGQTWMPVTAENIATSSPRSNDPSWDAHEQWYHSHGHFLNMISPQHTHCGVGIAYDYYGSWWGTQLFGYNTAFGDEVGGGTRAPPPAPAPAQAPAPVSAPASVPAGDSNVPNLMTGTPLSVNNVGDIDTGIRVPGH